jgi:hypothetical protein
VPGGLKPGGVGLLPGRVNPGGALPGGVKPGGVGALPGGVKPGGAGALPGGVEPGGVKPGGVGAVPGGVKPGGVGVPEVPAGGVWDAARPCGGCASVLRLSKRAAIREAVAIEFIEHSSHT